MASLSRPLQPSRGPLVSSRWRPTRRLADAARRWLTDGAPHGAAIAFYVLLALLPLVGAMLLIGQTGFGFDIGATWPAPLDSAAGHRTALLLGAAAFAGGTTGAFVHLRRALNTIGRLAPMPATHRAPWPTRLKGFALLMFAGACALACLLSSVLLANAPNSLLPSRDAAWWFGVLDPTVSTLLCTLLFAGLLNWLPEVAPGPRARWGGALWAALLFVVGTHLAALALVRGGAWAGGTAGLVVLMLWVVVSVQGLLYGSALAAEIDVADGLVQPKPGRALSPAPTVDQPLPHAVVPPTSLAAVRSRLRPTSGRRHGAPAARHGSAVLLRFPERRCAQKRD